MRDLQIELGGGAHLRSLTASDAEALFALVEANRVRLARWFSWVDGITDVAAMEAWIGESAADGDSLDGNGVWVDEELVGACELVIHRRHDMGDLVFWLDESAVGRGLVTRGCQALIDLGFRDAELHRVQMRSGVDNLRSRAVAKRLKMREEGVLRGAGKVGGGLYVDLVVYGLLQDEWRTSV